MGQVDPKWRKPQQAKSKATEPVFASLGSFFTDMTDIDTFIGDGLDKLPTSMQQTTPISPDPLPIPIQELEKSQVLDTPLDPITEINKVYCMDCVEGMKRMPSDFIDCCITDPPYEVDYMRKIEMLRDMDRGTHKHDDNGFCVDSAEHNVTIDWEGWAKELYRIMKKDTHLYVFWSERQSHKLIPMLEKVGFKWCQYLVWVKNRPTMDATWGHKYAYQHELCGFFQKGWRKLNRENSLRTILKWDIMGDGQNYKHPTQKPVKIIREFVVNSTNQSDLVFDGFMGCFDEKTEVLTKDGWKFFKDVEKGDKICSLNPKTKVIEFVDYTRKIAYMHKGDMFYIKGRSIDSMITPNHKIYVHEYHDKKDDINLKTMSEFKYEWFHFYNQGMNKSNKTMDKNWLRFLGFWIGDGYKLRRKHDYRVGFTLKKKRKIVYLKNLIRNMKLEIKEYKKTGKFYIKDRYLWSILDGVSHTKIVPEFVFSLSDECINAFLNGLFEADGWNGKQYYTCNETLANQVQILLLLIGKSAIVSKRKGRIAYFKRYKSFVKSGCQYVVCIYGKNKRLSLQRSKNLKIIKNWEGMVYDVTLEKNHILYVRRNGKAIWSGNSGTTAVAAKQLNRNFIGFEITKHYVDNVINERLQQEQIERWFE